MLKAGILFPRSGIFPLLGNDLLGGIRSFLRTEGIESEVQLLMEPVGYGADKKEAYHKAEHLLMTEQVDVLVAFLDLKVGSTLYPLAGALEKPLVLVNPGANYAENWVAPENVILLTLQDALLCRLGGIEAASTNTKEALFAISYFDGGYHHGHAMVTPFLENGGEIIFNYVSPLRTADFTIEPLQKFLEENGGTQTLLTIFSGEESNNFLSALASVKNAKELVLYASPQMLEEQTLAKLTNKIPFTIHSYLPWYKSIESDANHFFIKAIESETKRPANIFSLLGWESGQLLERLLKADADSAGKFLTDELSRNKLVTPRGELHLDNVSHNLIGPAYAASYGPAGLKYQAVMDAGQCLLQWQSLMKAGEIETASGWLNTYLCY